MRLFVAVDIEPEIRRRLTAFIAEMHSLAPQARWQDAANLHVTLKFMGETAAEKAERVKQSLAKIGHPPVEIAFTGCGFFPNERAARVFWAGVDGGDGLVSLAGKVDEAMVQLGFEREQRTFHPHLTLARASGRSSGNPHQRSRGGNSMFAKLAQTIAEMRIEFGRMSAHEFYLYESKLSPKGAQYVKLAGFPLS